LIEQCGVTKTIENAPSREIVYRLEKKKMLSKPVKYRGIATFK
jgi:hypothetical protein